MSKKQTIAVIAILILISCSDLTANEEVLRLKNIESGFVVTEFLEKETRFHDPVLREEMETKGIPIPLSDRPRYGGKEHILLGDKQFQEAFVEFYYTHQFNTDTYRWE